MSSNATFASTQTIAHAELSSLFGSKAPDMLVLAVAGGLILAVLLAVVAMIRAIMRARRAEGELRARHDRLSRELNILKTLLSSESQALIVWELGDDSPRLVTYSLRAETGVPVELRKILRFASWLERDSAVEFEACLSGLRSEGIAFNRLLHTANGSSIEAEGMPSGSFIVLRFRELRDHGKERARLANRLREVEDELATRNALLQALPVSVWLRGSDDRLQWVNQAYIAAVDAASLDEVVEKQIELLETRQRANIRGAVAAGSIFRQRLQTIVAGMRRSYDIVAVPIERASAGAAIDVAPLETAKGELERQTAAHARTLDCVTTGVAIFSSDRHLSFSNAAFARLWQLEPAWLNERPGFGEFLDRLRAARRLPEQADYRGWRNRQMAAFDGAAKVEMQEQLWYLPDGRSIHIISDQRPDGGVTFLYDDVTEKLALESRYNALIRVQRETLDHLREGVAVFSTDGRLRLHNPAFSDIWGLSAEFLDTSPHIEELARRSADRAQDSTCWAPALQAATGISDERHSLESCIEFNDGRTVAHAVVPLPDGATMLTYVDITDSKRAEAALIQRNEALEAADRLKNRFLSHVSYELRTPLTSIIGYSEFMGSDQVGPLNERQGEYLGHIRSSSQDLLAIINDILDLATIDAGALDLKMAEVDVRAIVDAAELGVRERLSSEHLTLDVSVAPEIRTIIADEKRITQILYNLLSNAIGFSEPGGSISLDCIREGAMIRFSVQDTGCGIPEDFQEKVFKRFESRPHGSRHRGAGLGLALVKSLVELHGGRVELRSAQGTGTTVSVLIPHNAQRRLGSNTTDAGNALAVG
jgi:signal transduction histidine kinase